ncbi:MAG: D-tyrosyl-tRNA(Tyr) deacylase [Synergistaceae bacterium]|jgi:D-tyrosyl-tRNA(Tyr) deacylase|nr:D-tyrosyl-tRNA(Tyr) deacylase [Synergistaceae bacterium]
MRLVLQRVSRASVSVGGTVIGEIGAGLCILIGVSQSDSEADASLLAEKVVNLRIFEDDRGKMNKSLLDVGGEVLAVSQFTLYADCGKGRRPSFLGAALPEPANVLYRFFVDRLGSMGIAVRTGEFGAFMSVEIINDGPVTIILDSCDFNRPLTTH